MPVVEFITSSGLGSLLGMRHALEPDHLAAVSTLVSQERNGFRAAWLGVCWGIGHTLALIVVAAALIVLRAEMPPAMASLFELLVAAMLIALGLRAIAIAWRQAGGAGAHRHGHGFMVHTHGGAPHVHIGAWTLARRPLIIGALHGLAGSGALTALVLAALPTTAARLTYMALFGIGSTLGMAVVSGLLGWPLARLGANQTVARTVSLTVGCVSTLLGVWWGFSIVGAGFGRP
jgi:High-affinity nickel-transport protein